MTGAARGRRRLGARLALALARAIAVTALLAPGAASAHVNSPDLVHQGTAGPYRLLVTIRPPDAIPGVALIEVAAERPDLGRVTVVPLPIAGPGAAASPVPDVAERDSGDARRYRGSLWLMAPGSWQIRVHAEGPDGAGELSIPVPALALRTKAMRPMEGAILLGLLAFLVAGLISIVGAALREAPLPPGGTPDGRHQRRARVAEMVTAVVLAIAVAAGKVWWSSEDSFYRRWVYKPLDLAATVEVQGAAAAGQAAGPVIALSLTDPGWLKTRHLDDLLPDHGHLMHLFAVRLPELDLVAHLHPTEVGPGRFTQALPPLPEGRYQLYADIVHANGMAETAAAVLTVPPVAGTGPATAVTGDDAVGSGPPLSTVAAGSNGSSVAALPDGTRVVWLRDAQPLAARLPTWFRFRIEDRDGSPVRDLAPYMGMAGHAMFMEHDRSVFAHVHPSGSVPMAALALLDGAQDPHAGHAMHAAALPAEVAFPYAFPRAGDYRILVQVKRGATIETAFFDARVP